MKTKQFKTLAIASYTKGELDIKKAKNICKLLKAGEIRQYIKQLKRIEQEKTVRVVVPDITVIDNKMLSKIKSFYPKKRVVVEQNSELILGAKIMDNDLVYDLSLKNRLDSLNDFMIEQYD
jgi:hypothetical protein